MVRILVADTFPLFRDGICHALAADAEVEIVGQAETIDQLLELADTTAPDVVLCDDQLSGNGIEATRALHLHLPNARVILVGTEAGDEHLYQAVKVGASAYLLRTESPDTLVSVIRRVARGEHLIDEEMLERPQIASRLLEEFTARSGDTVQDLRPLYAPLTPREIEILDQICRGNGNKQIARTLTISEQTVKNHMTSILKKLAVNDRTEAVVYSLRHGWIKMAETGEFDNLSLPT